jgi:transporter family-2 protein
MKQLAIVIAFLIGVSLPFQAGVNARFGVSAGNAFYGAVLNFAVGLLVLAVIVPVFVRPGVPTGTQIAGAPWWAWLGGCIGVFYVAGAAILAPRMGAVYFLATAVVGQMVGSMLVDKFGLVGMPVREVSLGRVLGVVLVVAGVAVIAHSTKPAAA